ncbi:site-specific integrase [Sphingomonas paeninsulae]|uniref:Site-specific integrase n=1 Tax=Sphingomonas paeninsulae TaxID=2319844 RepID=A0A494TJG8_SPHPE|nr:site-specific integrase [Sphingomonas paeninsulae]AYJ85548.1 site-specific integrase [Sphingomonas paeninsulae]
MAIYPDKKAGVLTGRFAVEVQKGAQRLRGRKDTLAEAKILEAEFRLALDSGAAPTSKRKFTAKASRPDTLSEAIKRADGILWSGKTSEDTAFQQLRAIMGIIGDRKLDAIGPSEIDDLVIELSKGRTGATINRYLSTLSVFLKWCLKREYRTFPVPSMDWQDEDEGRIRWIGHNEEGALLGALRGTVADVVRVAIATGMRRSEILTLKPDQLKPNWVHLWKTKNGSARSVPISPKTYAEIASLLKLGMPSASKLRYEWQLAREAMGLMGDKDFVFHCCRHTCATRLVQANVNLRVVQTFLGHKTIQTTLRYAHLNDHSLTDALSIMQTFHENSQSVHT